jgi:hypothetical protein
MSKFRLRSVDGTDIPPKEWLLMWAALFPEADYHGYSGIIEKHKSFSSADFEEIGKWKDGATGARWRPNVASVAYPIWMAAASESPKCPENNDVTKFFWMIGRKGSTWTNTRMVRGENDLAYREPPHCFISLAVGVIPSSTGG